MPPPEFTLDIPIFSKLYDFYKNLSQTVPSFPKTKRYTLGQRLDSTTLDIIELTVTASYLPRDEKFPILRKVSIKLDLVKIFLRLERETKSFDNNKYQQLASQVIEIGKMLGGWIKTVR